MSTSYRVTVFQKPRLDTRQTRILASLPSDYTPIRAPPPSRHGCHSPMQTDFLTRSDRFLRGININQSVIERKILFNSFVTINIWQEKISNQ